MLFTIGEQMSVINGYGYGTAIVRAVSLNAFQSTNEDNKCVWKCPSEKN